MKWISIVRAAGVVVSVSLLAAQAQAAGPYAVHARELVTAEDGVVVHGSIGVHATGGAPYRITLGAVKVDGDRMIAGGSVMLGNGAVVGPVATDLLSATGAQYGIVSPMVSVEDVLPRGPFDVLDVTLQVDAHSTLTLAPGTYGHVVVGEGASLRLSGGLYVFASLRLNEGATILVVQDAVVNVAGLVRLGDHTTISAASDAPGDTDMVIETIGTDVAGAAIRIGEHSALVATFRAASGAVRVGAHTTIEGDLLGRLVHLGTGVTVLKPSFVPLFCAGLTCMAGAIDVLCENAVCPSFGGACPAPGDNPCTVAGLPIRKGCSYSLATNGTVCDENLCSVGLCFTGICIHENPQPDGALCSDGDPCNGVDRCAHALVADKTIHFCAHSGDLPDGASCSDDDPCNGLETCLAGACSAGAPLKPQTSCGVDGTCTCAGPANTCVDKDGAGCGEGHGFTYTTSSPMLQQPNWNKTGPLKQVEVTGAAVISPCVGIGCDSAACPNGRLFVSYGNGASPTVFTPAVPNDRPELTMFDLQCPLTTTNCGVNASLGGPCSSPGDPPFGAPIPGPTDCLAPGQYILHNNPADPVAACDTAATVGSPQPRDLKANDDTDNQIVAVRHNLPGGGTKDRVVQAVLYTRP